MTEGGGRQKWRCSRSTGDSLCRKEQGERETGLCGRPPERGMTSSICWVVLLAVRTSSATHPKTKGTLQISAKNNGEDEREGAGGETRTWGPAQRSNPPTPTTRKKTSFFSENMDEIKCLTAHLHLAILWPYHQTIPSTLDQSISVLLSWQWS